MKQECLNVRKDPIDMEMLNDGKRGTVDCCTLGDMFHA